MESTKIDTILLIVGLTILVSLLFIVGAILSCVIYDTTSSVFPFANLIQAVL